MCLFLFLGSVSYLSGAVNLNGEGKLSRFQFSKNLNFFSNASPLRIFNKFSQANFAWENKEERELTNFDSYIVNKKQFINKLKKYVKLKIIDKLKFMSPKISITEEDFIGYFLYKWISENKLLVTIKFKLLSLGKLSWYYDQFSVSLNS